MRCDRRSRTACTVLRLRAVRLIPERQLLLCGEVQVRIGGRALDILTALVERPGEIVSKRELLSRVWPNTFVEEGNLKVNMAALRRALREGPATAQYIATVVGRAIASSHRSNPSMRPDCRSTRMCCRHATTTSPPPPRASSVGRMRSALSRRS